MKDHGDHHYVLGLEVCSDSKGMFLYQHKYTKDLISLAGLTLATPVDTPPLEVYVKYCCDVGDLLSDPLLYRKLVSILNYLTITRPDISFAVQQHPVTSFHSGILVISRAYGYLLNPCGSYFKPFKDVGFCYGRGGGIALLWRSSYNCSIVNFSQNHINVQVTDQVNGNWRLTGFYGFPNGATEKKGRTDRAHWLINGFRSAVTDAGLIDVHMEGHPLTWFKSLGTIQAVKERLDRALTNDGWFQLFPNAILENLPALVSDHYPILLIREP
ncbi:endonuclease/exonuclease/phosphatase family protein, partial [Trifolium pratense]